MIVRVAGSIVHELRHQPLVLALIILNVLFLASTILMWREVSAAVERKDALLTTMAKECFDLKDQKKQ
jgi:uncharacterized membrane protein YidH (DUF202 family)